jgi:hypothetical protein
MSGKGSKQRPTDLEAYSSNYDAIFKKNKTEAQEKALDELVRINQELGLYDMDLSDNPLVKK